MKKIKYLKFDKKGNFKKYLFLSLFFLILLGIIAYQYTLINSRKKTSEGEIAALKEALGQARVSQYTSKIEEKEGKFYFDPVTSGELLIFVNKVSKHVDTAGNMVYQLVETSNLAPGGTGVSLYVTAADNVRVPQFRAVWQTNINLERITDIVWKPAGLTVAGVEKYLDKTTGAGKEMEVRYSITVLLGEKKLVVEKVIDKLR